MSPLTDTRPKPLLKVGEMSLIEHHLTRLEQQGFKNIVINLDYLGEQIRDCLGDGSRFGLSIAYSDESDTGALETAGGLSRALPLIKSDRFIVANADIWTDYPFLKLLDLPRNLAHLVMVTNPPHNQKGDFCFAPETNAINAAGVLKQCSPHQASYTFSGIAAYHKRLFKNLGSARAALAPLFYQLAAKQTLNGEIYRGIWYDIGTPERLEEVVDLYQNSKMTH